MTSKATSRVKEYTIEKITDIFAIPKESFADFLVDLETYYNLSKDLTDLIHGALKATGVKSDVIPTKFIWTDDGRHDAKITIVPTFEHPNLLQKKGQK